MASALEKSASRRSPARRTLSGLAVPAVPASTIEPRSTASRPVPPRRAETVPGVCEKSTFQVSGWISSESCTSPGAPPPGAPSRGGELPRRCGVLPSRCRRGRPLTCGFASVKIGRAVAGPSRL